LLIYICLLVGMEKAQLFFIPVPGAGHLVSTIEFARRLLAHDTRLSATILVITSPWHSTPIPDPKTDSNSTLRFIVLPEVEPPSKEASEPAIMTFVKYINSYTQHVRDVIKLSISGVDSVPVAGLVMDVFCISMNSIAKELGIASYLFYTSSAAFLGLMLHLPSLYDRGQFEFNESNHETIFPSFKNPLPSSTLPQSLHNKQGLLLSINQARQLRETKGIIVNTFAELEPYALNSLQDGKTPPVYTVGPILDLVGQTQRKSNPDTRDKIMTWLNAQLESSVVFLCFGSLGSMHEAQMKEVALGLMHSGTRFLWSVRKPSADKVGPPTDYTEEDLKKILPVEFMSLLEEGIRGMVCGWAPQVEVLAHNAIAGFVSHCGWNSTLESLWFGRPIVTWPMYAEQQSNAFELVKELGLAVEMALSYNKDGEDVVVADELEKAIRCLMDQNSEVGKRVKEVAEISRRVLREGGSSYNSLGCFIEDALKDHHL
ncbi:hypothetical protein Ancab_016542, partial [Ancistrocladus abbreviatus]